MKNLAAQSPSLANPVTETFLASLDRAVHASCPYDYWLLNNSLPDETCAAIEALPIAPPTGLVYDGTRDANNSVRSYFAPKERALFPVCEQVTQTFSDPEVLAALEDVSGAKLMGSQLRIEYTQDITGFWLVPHPDLAVKVFTMLIYLSDDPALADARVTVSEVRVSPDLKNATAYVAPFAGGDAQALGRLRRRNASVWRRKRSEDLLPPRRADVDPPPWACQRRGRQCA